VGHCASPIYPSELLANPELFRDFFRIQLQRFAQQVDQAAKRFEDLFYTLSIHAVKLEIEVGQR
jgi:hypothetical protein